MCVASSILYVSRKLRPVCVLTQTLNNTFFKSVIILLKKGKHNTDTHSTIVTLIVSDSQNLADAGK